MGNHKLGNTAHQKLVYHKSICACTGGVERNEGALKTEEIGFTVGNTVQENARKSNKHFEVIAHGPHKFSKFH